MGEWANGREMEATGRLDAILISTNPCSKNTDLAWKKL